MRRRRERRRRSEYAEISTTVTIWIYVTVTELTDSTLKHLLGLSEDADLNLPFSDLDVDSWDFIEARTVLETRHNINFTDDEWMALERPSDILAKRSVS
jgi:acyl carrier protein